MQDTAIATQTSVNFTPMLGILFLATRLRASQVTNFTGSPQVYAQDAMYLAVFASLIQMVCALALPALSGNKSGFDDDGNSTYDLGPMFGAYMVTCVKYFVLLTLFGSMCVILYAVLTITPETANYATGPPDLYVVIQQAGWACLAVLAALILSSTKVIGLLVKFVVETFDSYAGVQITVKHAAVSIFKGYVNLSGVTISNPDKYADGSPAKFDSPYLISLNNVIVQMSLWQAITTRFKVIEIDFIACKGVDVILDKQGKSPSNLTTVKDILKPPEEYKKKGMLAECLGGAKKNAPKARCLPTCGGGQSASRSSWFGRLFQKNNNNNAAAASSDADGAGTCL